MAASVLQSLLDEEQLYVLEWPEPLLFSDIETPAISANFLPPVLRDFVTALAVATETPIEMALACALGTVSVALTGKVVVNPKPGWEEPVNTYWIVELLPANRKSKVFKSCTQPLILREKMGKNPALQGNGALERFLYIVPRSTIGFRTHDTIPMPAEIAAKYAAAVP